MQGLAQKEHDFNKRYPDFLNEGDVQPQIKLPEIKLNIRTKQRSCGIDDESLLNHTPPNEVNSNEDEFVIKVDRKQKNTKRP